MADKEKRLVDFDDVSAGRHQLLLLLAVRGKAAVSSQGWAGSLRREKREGENFGSRGM